MNCQVKLRPVTEQDLPFLKEVFACMHIEEMALTGWNKDQIEAFITQQFHAQHVHYTRFYPNASLDIILADGIPAGRLYVERTPREIRIMDICLLPAFRGRGIGYHYMQSIMDEAKSKGLAVSLHVEKNNPSKQLYDRLGFKISEDRSVYWFMEWLPDQLQNEPEVTAVHP